MSRLLKRLNRHANKNRYVLNEDPTMLKFLLDGLLNKRERYGDFFCPCRLSTAPENVCPCSTHKEDIKKNGYCNCHLFFKGGKNV